MSDSVTLILEDDQPAVSMSLESEPAPLVIEVGIPGPPGPDSSIVSRNASVALSGHRMVTLAADGRLLYADHMNVDHAGVVLGLTLNAAAENDPIDVKTYGEVTHAGWSWTPNESIFLGANGALTQVAPATGFSLVVGFALSATTMLINIEPPIIF
jgi:hypothetical protein